ncbi:hypothetical protein JMJ77_0005885, partial [Colletotrichum scovillei]
MPLVYYYCDGVSARTNSRPTH